MTLRNRLRNIMKGIYDTVRNMDKVSLLLTIFGFIGSLSGLLNYLLGWTVLIWIMTTLGLFVLWYLFYNLRTAKSFWAGLYKIISKAVLIAFLISFAILVIAVFQFEKPLPIGDKVKENNEDLNIAAKGTYTKKAYTFTLDKNLEATSLKIDIYSNDPDVQEIDFKVRYLPVNSKVPKTIRDKEIRTTARENKKLGLRFLNIENADSYVYDILILYSKTIDRNVSLSIDYEYYNTSSKWRFLRWVINLPYIGPS